MKSEKMMDVICEEIDKIADKGLTSQNIEVAYKLVDMYKDLKTVEGMDDYAEENYSQNDGYAMRGRGRNARRDSMGRYSRRYDRGNSFADGYEQRYMDSKMAYRNDHSMASKESMLEDLDAFMDEMHNKLKELKRDADTPEEKETIGRYIKMLERL
jgi:hypothetical protein